jgi:excisionase family DNA binding protein
VSGVEKKYLTVRELSEYLGIPKHTIYSWTSMKRIPYVKIGRLLRFDKNKIDSWLKERSIEPLEFFKGT